MKPTMQNITDGQARADRRQFPVTDFNYHAATLNGYNGRCAKPLDPSFRSISRDYFNVEAQRYFLAEALVFTAIMLTVTLPLVNGADAVLHLVRALGGV
jgi:hypothetical protein